MSIADEYLHKLVREFSVNQKKKERTASLEGPPGSGRISTVYMCKLSDAHHTQNQSR